MPVEALLLPLRMPLFCSFEIIALVGCGIDDCAFSFIYGHFRDRQGQRRMLNKRSLGRLEQRKAGFYYPVDKADHFLLAVLVIALHNDMHQAV